MRYQNWNTEDMLNQAERVVDGLAIAMKRAKRDPDLILVMGMSQAAEIWTILNACIEKLNPEAVEAAWPLANPLATRKRL